MHGLGTIIAMNNGLIKPRVGANMEVDRPLAPATGIVESRDAAEQAGLAKRREYAKEVIADLLASNANTCDTMHGVLDPLMVQALETLSKD